MIGTKKYRGAGVIAVIVFLLLTATFSSAEIITNTYDELDRLTKAEFGTRFRIEYSYDAYGNRSQKTITMLDSSKPDTTIVTKPGSFSTASVTFTFTSETNVTFGCQIDGGAWSACNSGTVSYSSLAEGSHTFDVKATDRSGNTDATPASYIWTVDTTPPDTNITGQPVNITNATTANFTFTSTEPTNATFQCQLDSGSWTACNGGTASYSSLADGSHTFNIKATDAAGNTDATPATFTWTVDTTPPDTTITAKPVNPTNINNASFTFISTEPTNATFQCQLDSGTWTACNSGTASYNGLSGSSHTFSVRATDAAGNADQTPATYTWTVDTTAPDTNITAKPENPTNINTASISFISTEGDSTFQCQLDAGAFSACTSPTSYAGLTAGSHTFNVKATDAAGNPDATPASYTWAVTSILTVSVTPASAGIVTGAAITCPDTCTATYSTPAEAVQLTATPNTGYRFLNWSGAIGGTNNPGNVLMDVNKAVTANFEIDDTTPPVTTATSVGYTFGAWTFAGTVNVTLAASDTDTGVASGYPKYCVDTTNNCNPSTDSTTLSVTCASGNSCTQYVRYYSVDNVNNEETVKSSIVKQDLQTSELSVSTLSDGTWTANGTLNVSGTVHDDASGLQSLMVNGDAVTVTDGTYSAAITLVPGGNTITVVATDNAGNTATDMRTINYDSNVPVITVTAPADNSVTNLVAMTVSGSVDANSRVTGVTQNSEPASFSFNSGDNTFAASVTLVEGMNTIIVSAADLAGNTSSAGRTVTLDDINPTLAVTDPGQDTRTNQSSMTISGTVSDATITTVLMSVDGGDSVTLTVVDGAFSSDVTFTTRKTYSITVTAIDKAGNHSTVTRNIIYDATGPVTVAEPAEGTYHAPQSVFLSCDDGTGTGSSGCSSTQYCIGPGCTPDTVYTGALDISSSTVLRFSSADNAGNMEDLKTRTYTINNLISISAGPDGSIDCTPNPVNYNSSSTCTISPNTGYSIDTVTVDSLAQSSLPSSFTFNNVQEMHTISATFADAAAPSLTVSTLSDGAWTSNGTLNVSGTVSDGGSGVQGVTVNGSSATVINSAFSKEVSLATGANVITVIATDNAGNTSTDTRVVTFDSTAPDTTITDKPSDPAGSPTANFSFTATEAGSVFECRLDGGSYAGCTRPMNYTGLNEGSHTFSVRATDATGNADQTPATYTWTVDTTAPDTIITGQPASLTNVTTASFTFTSTEPTGATFECKLDSGSFGVCTSPKAYTGLSEGSHAFSVRAIDAAGNTDQTPATYTWTIDTTSPSSAITSPDNGSGIINNAFTIRGTSADSGSGVSKVEISINNGTWTEVSGMASWSYVWTIPSEGTYTITSRATDAAGNVSTPGAGITVHTYSRTASNVTTSGRQLLVNGSPFTVKGVNYSPVPVGEDPSNPPYGDYFTEGYAGIYGRDLSQLLLMGANTISLSTLDTAGDHSGFLDAAYNNGVKPVYVIAGYQINAGLDLSDTNVRGQIKEDFKDMIKAHKDHPAILMWAIGSDLNSASMYGADKTDLFSLVNEMALEAHAGDSMHPVVMPLADEDLIQTITAYNTSVPALDLWGANVYRGSSFGSIFTEYQAVSTKPLLITGYGIDAYDDVNMAEDPQTQAADAGALLGEITASSAIAVGGVYTEWTDQWWMGGLSVEAGCPEANNPDTHGDCGTTDPSFHDGHDNFEWWGLMRVSDNEGNPDIIEARAAYNTLQYAWKGVYSLNVTKAGNGSGTVTSAPAGINCGIDCSELFLKDSNVTLTATPAANETFTEWSGDCSGTTNPLPVLMDRAKTCTATFTLNQYTLTVNKTGAGSGTVGGGGTYDYNTPHNITASAATGSTFGGWSGDLDCSDGQVTMDAAKTCTATFTINTYALTVNKTGTGSGTVGGGGTYDYNTSHNITATAATGSTFTGWSGDLDCSDGQVTMDTAKTCTATFVLNTYLVTTSSTNGTATPAGTQTINYGSTASVSGTANANFYFAGVSGCGGTTQSNANQTVTTFSYTTGTITSNCTVTATYAIITHTVTPSAGANGSISPATPQTVNHNATASFTATPNTGYIIASVSGCGGTLSGNSYTTGPITSDCTVSATFVANITHTVTPSAGANGSITPNIPQIVNDGATTSFTVTANTGYQIATVSGCGGTWSGSNPYVTGPITVDCMVSATFTLNQYALTVNKTGTGSGTVGGGGTYDYGTSHDITAAAGIGSTFTGWSGDCTGAVSPLSVLVDRAKTCTASFAINTYTVTPSAGAGGNISPSTAQTVNYNATTSFTVTPNTGYHILSVSGCGGTLSDNTYTTGAITSDCTVTASFAINTYTVTPSAGAGGGISPSTVQTVNYNATTSFTATPNAGYHVQSVKIDGADQGTIPAGAYNYTFSNVTINHEIDVVFEPDSRTITVYKTGSGTVTPGTSTVAYGTDATFTATPNAGYHVLSVKIDGVDQGTIPAGVYNYTFSNVTINRYFNVKFVPDNLTITVYKTGSGTVTPDTSTVAYGTDATFTATPNAGYHVQSVKIDGVDQGTIPAGVYTYTYSNVTINHYFNATFAQ